MKLKEKLSREFISKDWPEKSEWSRNDRYDTFMKYEIRSYIQDAYEAGFEKGLEVADKFSSVELKELGDEEVE